VTLSLGEGKRGASITAEYVGSQACVSCHGKEAAERVLGSAEGGIRPKLCDGFGFQLSDLEFRIGFFHMARLLHIGLKSNLQLFDSSIERARGRGSESLLFLLPRQQGPLGGPLRCRSSSFFSAWLVIFLDVGV
jgi:hypothetical protein